jgi:cell division septal protein FtsQ
MANLETLQQRLVDAETAYHQLMMGDREVEVTFSDGRKVKLGETDAVALKRYIDQLRTEIVAARVPHARGPVGFLF